MEVQRAAAPREGLRPAARAALWMACGFGESGWVWSLEGCGSGSLPLCVTCRGAGQESWTPLPAWLASPGLGVAPPLNLGLLEPSCPGPGSGHCGPSVWCCPGGACQPSGWTVIGSPGPHLPSRAARGLQLEEAICPCPEGRCQRWKHTIPRSPSRTVDPGLGPSWRLFVVVGKAEKSPRRSSGKGH